MKVDYLNEYHDASKTRGLNSARVVSSMVYQLVHPASVVDVGCGYGYWLKEFMALGAASVTGIDGDYINRDKLEIPANSFIEMDLNKPVPLDRTFDLAMSIEVAEHLRPESSERFVKYLCSLSRCILFSAGIPGQPGHNHINAQWPYFWSALFEQQGYVACDFIRPQIWHDESLMLCHRQNIVFYVHRDMATNEPFHELPRMNCLTLVDFDTLQHHLSVKESLSRIVRRFLGRR